MQRYVAGKPITLLGQAYKPGDEIPMEKVERHSPRLALNLIEQGRVLPDVAKLKVRA